MKRYSKRIGATRPDTQRCEAGPQDAHLTDAERQRFGELCAAVDRSMVSWIDAGKALLELRFGPDGKGPQRLYRERYKTFEAFILDKWGFTDRRARQLMESADTGERLQKHVACKVVASRTAREIGTLVPKNLDESDETPEIAPVPPRITERHVRAMGTLTDSERRALPTKIIDRALSLGGTLTAAKVAAATRLVREELTPLDERRTETAVNAKPRIEKCITLLAQLRRELVDIAESPGGELLRTARDGAIGQHLSPDITFTLAELHKYLTAAIK